MNIANVISDDLLSLKRLLPSEFSRKPRSLFEFRQWKATEFRQFLLYTGPVVLKGRLTQALYKNFMLLSVAIRILLNDASNSESYAYAEKVLKHFVKGVSKNYGDEQLVYNVHSLIHLPDDARKYGSLNNISCFPFESFLGHLKSVVCRPQSPVSQIIRRYAEKLKACDNVTLDHYSVNDVSKCHKQKHNAGPVPVLHNNCDQYKKYLGKYVVSVTKPNNCFEINGHVYLVKNILLKPCAGTFVVVQRFCRKLDFCDFPLPSSKLNIWVVDSLDTNSDFDVFPVDALANKMILLPYKDVQVAIPFVHTDKGKFQK